MNFSDIVGGILITLFLKSNVMDLLMDTVRKVGAPPLGGEKNSDYSVGLEDEEEEELSDD